MSDEIKMCKQVERIGDNRLFKQLHWVPLDPQPSCKNCGNWIGGSSSGTCNHAKVWSYEPDFFCKYWKVKE